MWISLWFGLFDGNIDAQKTETERHEEEDAKILAAIASRKKLASDLELAKGIQYTEPIRTSWVRHSLRSESIWKVQQHKLAGSRRDTSANARTASFTRYVSNSILLLMGRIYLLPCRASRYVFRFNLLMPCIEYISSKDMRIPDALIKFLKSKGIVTPTPIQIQGLPVAYVFV